GIGVIAPALSTPEFSECVRRTQLPEARALSFGDGDRGFVASFGARRLLVTANQQIAFQARELGFIPSSGGPLDCRKRLVNQLQRVLALFGLSAALCEEIACETNPGQRSGSLERIDALANLGKPRVGSTQYD